MAFIKGFRASNGLLTGEVWDFSTQNVTNLSWATAPGNQNRGVCSIGSGYMGGTNGAELGVMFKVPDISYTGWGNYILLASFEISGYSGSDYKRELRLVTDGLFNPFGPTTYHGNVRVSAFIRSYSDPVTYTDTLITSATGTDVQFHRNDAAGVYTRTVSCSFANVIYNNSHKVLIGISLNQDQNSAIKWLSAFTYFDYNYFWGLVDGNITEEEFSPEFGPASDAEGYTGGGGAGGPTAFDDHSDVIGIPTAPQSILGLGFLNVYKCDASSLTDFGGELFPDITFPTQLSDVGEVLAAVGQSIWNSKLIDYVISVHCVPTDVPAGTMQNIKIGTRTLTTINGRPITNEYVDFDFGSITIDEYYHNYIDYMCRFTLYLPFYGFVSLKPEEILGGSIHVQYRFNVIDGSFMAYILCTCARSKMANTLIGQYGGSAIVHLPVSNLSYSSMFASMIGGSATAAAGMATGNIGAMVSGALTEASGIAQALQGGDVKKSNSYNASSSFMTRRKPYIIVERPISSFSTFYNQENGLPSNIVYPIGACEGFTQVNNAILDGIPCTDAEKERLRAMLREGIIIKPHN